MDIHQNSCSREKWSVLMYNIYSLSRHGRANYRGLVSLWHVFIKFSLLQSRLEAQWF